MGWYNYDLLRKNPVGLPRNIPFCNLQPVCQYVKLHMSNKPCFFLSRATLYWSDEETELATHHAREMYNHENVNDSKRSHKKGSLMKIK